MTTKEQLKEKFSTGKKPTGGDFAELIDGVKGDKGDKGDPGVDGKDGTQGSPGKDGANGKSAYQIAVDNGFQGTESEWLLSKGEKGDKGEPGTAGTDGKDGAKGDPGTPGADGKDAEPQFTEEQVQALLAMIEDSGA